jgi:diguanylate cyclase (GGDEF)-like protein
MRAVNIKVVARATAPLCGLAALISVFTLFCYAVGFEPGWRLVAGGPAFNPLSAVVILLTAAGGVLLSLGRSRQVGVGLVALALAIVALRLIDGVAETGFIDRIMPFPLRIEAERDQGLRNQMGLSTASALLCYGIGWLLYAHKNYALGQVATAIGMAPPLASTIGYVYGVEVIAGRMSIYVVAALLILGIAGLAARSHRGAVRAILSEGIAGRFARQQLAVAFVAPVVFGLLFVRLTVHAGLGAGTAEIVVASTLAIAASIAPAAISFRRLDLARYHAEAQMKYQINFDALTGLLNRRSFDSALGELFQRARQKGKPISLLMCDLDHFKKVNDTYGHDTGDRVLRQVAKRLATSVRGSDQVFRYGGEEMVVLLVDCGPEQAVGIAEKIRERIRQKDRRAEIDQRLPEVTISIGAATSAEGRTDSAAVLAAADATLYEAKHAGRDRVIAKRYP